MSTATLPGGKRILIKPPTAEQLSDEALRKHTEALRPKPPTAAPDVFPGCMSDTRPRFRGELVLPLDYKS